MLMKTPNSHKAGIYVMYLRHSNKILIVVNENVSGFINLKLIDDLSYTVR